MRPDVIQPSSAAAAAEEIRGRVPVVSPSCYDLLGVPRDAAPGLLDLAFQRRRGEIRERTGDLPQSDVEAMLARIDEAYRILADPPAARRYHLYRAQVETGLVVADASAFVSLAPDEVATDPGSRGPAVELAGPIDARQSAPAVEDEWAVQAVFDEDDDIEVQRTQARAPAFPSALGLLADVVLAAPAPGDRASAPRRFSRRDAPPWLALDPAEPGAMRPPPYSPLSIPGSSIPPAASPGLVRHAARRDDRPPWETHHPDSSRPETGPPETP